MQELPDYNFETLKSLVNHLKLVSDNCDKNKVMWIVMHNAAIESDFARIFAPQK